MSQATPNATSGASSETPSIQNPERDEQDIAALLAAPCDIHMRQRNGMFYLYMKDVGVTACGKDLQASYAELMAQRELRLREFTALGILPWLPKPGESCASCPAPGVLLKLKPFFIKAAVITLLFLGAVTIVGQGLGAVGKQLENNLSAVSRWTPEKVERERDRAHAFAQRMRPLVRELVLMFQDPPADGGASSTRPEDKGK